MQLDVPSIIGLLGVGVTLLAYIMLQLRKINPMAVPFSLMNFGGSAGILLSIFYHWNIAAFAMEAAWILISFYGLLQATRRSLKKALH